MFYNHELLTRRGKFFMAWMAAFLSKSKDFRKYFNARKLTKILIARIVSDIESIVLNTSSENTSLSVERPLRFSLYLSSQLVFGTCKLFQRQVEILLGEVRTLNTNLYEYDIDREQIQKKKKTTKDDTICCIQKDRADVDAAVAELMQLHENSQIFDQDAPLEYPNSVPMSAITLPEEDCRHGNPPYSEDPGFGEEGSWEMTIDMLLNLSAEEIISTFGNPQVTELIEPASVLQPQPHYSGFDGDDRWPDRNMMIANGLMQPCSPRVVELVEPASASQPQPHHSGWDSADSWDRNMMNANRLMQPCSPRVVELVEPASASQPQPHHSGRDSADSWDRNMMNANRLMQPCSPRVVELVEPASASQPQPHHSGWDSADSWDRNMMNANRLMQRLEIGQSESAPDLHPSGELEPVHPPAVESALPVVPEIESVQKQRTDLISEREVPESAIPPAEASPGLEASESVQPPADPDIIPEVRPIRALEPLSPVHPPAVEPRSPVLRPPAESDEFELSDLLPVPPRRPRRPRRLVVDNEIQIGVDVTDLFTSTRPLQEQRFDSCPPDENLLERPGVGRNLTKCIETLITGHFVTREVPTVVHERQPLPVVPEEILMNIGADSSAAMNERELSGFPAPRMFDSNEAETTLVPEATLPYVDSPNFANAQGLESTLFYELPGTEPVVEEETEGPATKRPRTSDLGKKRPGDEARDTIPPKRTFGEESMIGSDDLLPVGEQLPQAEPQMQHVPEGTLSPSRDNRSAPSEISPSPVWEYKAIQETIEDLCIKSGTSTIAFGELCPPSRFSRSKANEAFLALLQLHRNGDLQIVQERLNDGLPGPLLITDSVRENDESE